MRRFDCKHLFNICAALKSVLKENKINKIYKGTKIFIQIKPKRRKNNG